MRMRVFVLFLLACFCTSSLLADPSISSSSHIANRQPGYCAWASLEILGRHHRIKALYGLVDLRASYTHAWHWNGVKWIQTPASDGWLDTVERQLDQLKVKSVCVWDRNDAAKNLVITAVAKDLGCVVGLYNYPGYGDHHAVVAVGLNNEEFKFIDSNHVGYEYTAERAWFNEHFSGLVFVVYPD